MQVKAGVQFHLLYIAEVGLSGVDIGVLHLHNTVWCPVCLAIIELGRILKIFHVSFFVQHLLE